jgi:hypothetical protein
LKGVDAHLLGIDLTSPIDLGRGANFTLATAASGLEVWTDAAELKGSPPWLEIRARAISVWSWWDPPCGSSGLTTSCA